MAQYPIFGQSSSNSYQSRSCKGIAGFFTCPPAWSVTTDAQGQQWATSNTGKIYALEMDYDGTLCFQDLLLSRINGQS